jgi:hypothetical protein
MSGPHSSAKQGEGRRTASGQRQSWAEAEIWPGPVWCPRPAFIFLFFSFTFSVFLFVS